MDFGYIKLPKGVEMRDLYDGERKYFEKNPNVSGMATEDGKVILNPYSELSQQEYQAVATNEAVRLAINRDESLVPDFELTDQQKQFLDTTSYRYADERDRKATIAARLVSGDPSGGVSTAEQDVFVNMLKTKLFGEQ